MSDPFYSRLIGFSESGYKTGDFLTREDLRS